MKTADPLLRALGVAVRSRRVDRGESQETLALSSGLDRSYIGSVERGERNIGLLTLRTLADGLGSSLTDLVLDAHRIQVELPDIELALATAAPRRRRRSPSERREPS